MLREKPLIRQRKLGNQVDLSVHLDDFRATYLQWTGVKVESGLLADFQIKTNNELELT